MYMNHVFLEKGRPRCFTELISHYTAHFSPLVYVHLFFFHLHPERDSDQSSYQQSDEEVSEEDSDGDVEFSGGIHLTSSSLSPSSVILFPSSLSSWW